MNDHLRNSKQVAAMLGISLRKLWELQANGELKSLRIGRAIRFRPEDVDAFIRAQLKKGGRP